MLVIVNHQYAVSTLGSTELTCVCNADALGHGESGQWAQGRYGAGHSCGSSRPPASWSASRRRRRLSSLSVEVRFDFFADSLCVEERDTLQRQSVSSLQTQHGLCPLIAHLIALALPLASVSSLSTDRGVSEACRGTQVAHLDWCRGAFSAVRRQG